MIVNISNLTSPVKSDLLLNSLNSVFSITIFPNLLLIAYELFIFMFPSSKFILIFVLLNSLFLINFSVLISIFH